MSVFNEVAEFRNLSFLKFSNFTVKIEYEKLEYLLNTKTFGIKESLKFFVMTNEPLKFLHSV